MYHLGIGCRGAKRRCQIWVAEHRRAKYGRNSRATTGKVNAEPVVAARWFVVDLIDQCRSGDVDSAEGGRRQRRRIVDEEPSSAPVGIRICDRATVESGLKSKAVTAHFSRANEVTGSKCPFNVCDHDVSIRGWQATKAGQADHYGEASSTRIRLHFGFRLRSVVKIPIV